MTQFLGNHLRREKIENDAMRNNLSHALLLCGPSGTEKFEFLKYLAKKILQNPKARPPELVIVDMLYTEGQNTDMDRLSQSSTFNQLHRKKLKKRTDSIGVDDVEEFTKHLYETVEGDYKIVLIRDIERMPREAANKFLKMLEEPPAKTLFLMTTSAEKKLLPTIISRTRRENFSLIPDNQIADYISDEGGNFSPNEQEVLKNIASGRSRILKEMMSTPDFFSEEQEKWNLSHTIKIDSNLQKMDIAEDFAKKTAPEINEFLKIFETYLRTLLRKDINNINTTSIHLKALENIQSAKNGLKKNGNKRMILEELFLSL